MYFMLCGCVYRAYRSNKVVPKIFVRFVSEFSLQFQIKLIEIDVVRLDLIQNIEGGIISGEIPGPLSVTETST